MQQRRRRISWILWFFSAASVAALVAVALVALRAIAVSQAAAAAAARADLAALEDATELQGLLYQKGFVAEFFLTGDQRWLDELSRQVPAFEGWLTSLTRDVRTPAIARATATLVAEYGRYDADRARSIAQYRAGDRAGAVATLVANTERAAHLRELASGLIRLRRQEVSAGIEAAQRAFRQALFGLALALTLAILGAAISGYLLARRVARPLYDLVLRAESAAGGARVAVSADDEIEALGEHVARLAERIESSSAELAEQRARLVQAEKMSALGEMATALAHEVLNPLAGIKAAVQLLARTHPGDGVRETARAVDAEVLRVDALARRLMAFARPHRPDLKPLDLGHLFERVVWATRGEADAREVTVRSFSDGVATATGDFELLSQVLVNLTVNACQASGQGGVVSLSAHREGSWEVIDVRDQGCGIEPEMVARLFTPFHTTKADGHGLGLAISQNIALAHGGRIEARSNAPERGVTFSLFLPNGRS
jgi:signal transduction histidine kinase